MKNIYLVAFSLFLLSCSNYEKTAYGINDEKAYLVVTSATTEPELEKIAQEFYEQKGIVIDVSKSEYDNAGTIHNLSLEVDCQDGYSGTASASSVSLLKTSYGFYRDYRPSIEIPFYIGSMEDYRED